jgi:hypothetical protein
MLSTMPRIARLVAPAVAIGLLAPLGFAGEDLSRVPVHRSGTEFTLRALLGEAAYPMLFHVDPMGHAALVHPPISSAELEHVSPGRPVVWPDPASGEVWTLSGEPGYETFILVACAEAGIDLFAVEAEIGALAEASRAEGRPRAELVAEIEAYLADAFGPVRTTTILHLP